MGEMWQLPTFILRYFRNMKGLKKEEKNTLKKPCDMLIVANV